MILRKKEYGMLLLAITPPMFIVWMICGIKYGFVESAIRIAVSVIIALSVVAWADFFVSLFFDDKQTKQRNNENKSTTS